MQVCGCGCSSCFTDEPPPPVLGLAVLAAAFFHPAGGVRTREGRRGVAKTILAPGRNVHRRKRFAHHANAAPNPRRRQRIPCRKLLPAAPTDAAWDSVLRVFLRLGLLCRIPTSPGHNNPPRAADDRRPRRTSSSQRAMLLRSISACGERRIGSLQGERVEEPSGKPKASHVMSCHVCVPLCVVELRLQGEEHARTCITDTHNPHCNCLLWCCVRSGGRAA